MDLRPHVPVAGLLGGLVLVLRWLVDLGSWDEPVRWVGLGLLALAVAVLGAGLVSTSALALRLLVAVAFPLLLWSLVSAVSGTGDATVPEGMVGLLAVVASVAAIVRARHAEPGAGVRGSQRGSHAAR